MSNLNKLRSKKKLTWILLQNMFKQSGIGTKQKVNFWLRREERKERREKEKRRSDYYIIKILIQNINCN